MVLVCFQSDETCWCVANQNRAPRFPGSQLEVFQLAAIVQIARASEAVKKAVGPAGCPVVPSPDRYRPPAFSDSANPRYPPIKREVASRLGKNQVRENQACRADPNECQQAQREFPRALLQALHQ